MLKLGLRPPVSALFLLAIGLVAGTGASAPAQTLSGPAHVQANRVADNADLNARAQVSGHIPAWATPAADAGTVANDAPELLTFDIARSPEVQSAFDQLLADQQNPASPRYHQWLTPQQIGDQYGPTQHDLDAFTAWLTSAGFTVSNVAASRTFVQVTAPASVVNSALQTSLHSFNVNGGKLQAPLTEPAFPAVLAPMVKFVSGLATVQYRTHSTLMPKLPLSALGISAPGSTSAGVHPDFTLGTGGTVHYLSPADFNLIYDITPTLNAGITGTGYRVAIIGGSRLLASDLSNWESISALATYQPNYIVPTGLVDPGTTSDGNQGEGTLDFERVYGTAPGVQVDQVISKNWLTSDTDTLEIYAINTLNDPVLTMSYGACETGNTMNAQHENSIFAQAIAQGISVFASSGDSGVAGCDNQGTTPPASQYASIQSPCDSAYLTCVGGTQFSDTANPSAYWSAMNATNALSALSYIPEGGWNEPVGTNSAGGATVQVAASTGGPSLAITKPSWQTGSNVPADGARDVPDIAFSSSGHNAYFTCLTYDGADCTKIIDGFGGTSASAPSMAGLAAIIDQKLGKRQGLLNPLLYTTAASTPAAFHDATPATSGVSTCTTSTPSTCNNSDATPTSATTAGILGYPLLTGYDFPTGLGSLDFGKFLTVISLPAPNITVTSTPATITISQTVQLTATLTSNFGTPTGTVQFYSSNPQLYSNTTTLGAPVTLVNGVATTPALSYMPAATYNITAVYSGSTTLSQTTSAVYALVVTNPAAVASSVGLTVTPVPATTLQPTTLVATVKGNGSVVPTGTVQFYDAGSPKGSPVTLSTAGVATLAAGTLTATTHSFTCLYSGDATYAASSCSAVSDVVSSVPTTTVETLSTSTITASGSTNLSYTVSSPAGGTPTGTITAYTLEMSPVASTTPVNQGSVTLSNGVASGTFSGVSPGTYTLYGVYSGDASYTASTSQNLTLTVTGFNMAVSPASLSFSAGASTGNAVTVTYTPINGFTGTITESCKIATTAIAVPVGPNCSVSPATVALTGASATSVVTIGSSASLVNGGKQFISLLRTGALGGLSFAGLLLLLLPSRRKVLRNWRALSLLIFLSMALFTASGCGSSSTSGGGGNSSGGTTRGTYNLTVTASSNGQTSTTTIPVTIN